MDPDQTLADLRAMADSILLDGEDSIYLVDPCGSLETFADRFQALDEWMSSSGYNPWRNRSDDDPSAGL